MPFQPEGSLTVEDVMHKLSITRRTFDNYVTNDPDFKTYKIGARRFMDHEDLTNWINAKRATKDKK